MPLEADFEKYFKNFIARLPERWKFIPASMSEPPKTMDSDMKGTRK
jgi:hypothetical protein